MDILEKIAELLQKYSEDVIDLSRKLDTMNIITNNDKAKQGIIKRNLCIALAKKDVLEELMDEVDLE